MAATTQSAERILQVAAQSDFSVRVNDGRRLEGDVQTVTVKVPLTTDNAALNVIELIELPDNAIVFPELSFVIVTDDATSGALTLDIGDSVDPDRYADGINAASAGKIEFTSVASTTVPDGLHNRYKVVKADGTNLIKLTLATFTATIEAGEIIVVIAFKSL